MQKQYLLNTLKKRPQKKISIEFAKTVVWEKPKHNPGAEEGAKDGEEANQQHVQSSKRLAQAQLYESEYSEAGREWKKDESTLLSRRNLFRSKRKDQSTSASR